MPVCVRELGPYFQKFLKIGDVDILNFDHCSASSNIATFSRTIRAPFESGLGYLLSNDLRQFALRSFFSHKGPLETELEPIDKQRVFQEGYRKNRPPVASEKFFHPSLAGQFEQQRLVLVGLDIDFQSAGAERAVTLGNQPFA